MPTEQEILELLMKASGGEAIDGVTSKVKQAPGADPRGRSQGFKENVDQPGGPQVLQDIQNAFGAKSGSIGAEADRDNAERLFLNAQKVRSAAIDELESRFAAGFGKTQSAAVFNGTDKPGALSGEKHDVDPAVIERVRKARDADDKQKADDPVDDLNTQGALNQTPSLDELKGLERDDTGVVKEAEAFGAQVRAVGATPEQEPDLITREVSASITRTNPGMNPLAAGAIGDQVAFNANEADQDRYNVAPGANMNAHVATQSALASTQQAVARIANRLSRIEQRNAQLADANRQLIRQAEGGPTAQNFGSPL